MEKKETLSIDEMSKFCKRKGFVVPSGEIYGGFSGFFDYLELGNELKKNIKKSWSDFFVKSREEIVEIDGSIITHPQIWRASGHLENFSDVFVKCKKCKKPSKIDKSEIGKIKCECGGVFDFSSVRDFELMFKTKVGEDSEGYLRPETAQLIFSNFKESVILSRLKVPFGIAQIGKSFRNEIAPRNFLFRCREFEQMEIEYFIKSRQKCPFEIPNLEISILSSGNKKEIKMNLFEAFNNKIIRKDWHAYWIGQCLLWFKSMGCDLKNFRLRQHDKEELAHYSTDCWDIEYNFPFGWKELIGIADRGDYDLSQHQKFSKKDLSLLDEESGNKFLPNVICEPSFGVERTLLVLLYEAYSSDDKGNVFLNFNPKIAPIKVAVFPIIKSEEYEEIANEIVKDLRKEWNVSYDRSGSIGRRYARNDEIGTPFCLTIDDKTSEDKTVTLRERNSKEQKRILIKDLRDTLRKLIFEEISFEEL